MTPLKAHYPCCNLPPLVWQTINGSVFISFRNTQSLSLFLGTERPSWSLWPPWRSSEFLCHYFFTCHKRRIKGICKTRGLIKLWSLHNQSKNPKGVITFAIALWTFEAKFILKWIGKNCTYAIFVWGWQNNLDLYYVIMAIIIFVALVFFFCLWNLTEQMWSHLSSEYYLVCLVDMLISDPLRPNMECMCPRVLVLFFTKTGHKC